VMRSHKKQLKVSVRGRHRQRQILDMLSARQRN